jgi:pimeloyl-ACP methyl ester carboxylesterase
MSRLIARTMDAAMCAMMNHFQWRLRNDACTLPELEAYLTAGESMTREMFYRVPPEEIRPRNGLHAVQTLEWPSPAPSGLIENDTARALWFIGPGGPSAPTAIVLHALMSASDIGYRRLAGWFHERGWNMMFPHLPFHYSRVPRGHRNGSLAISANLPRNGETLRQAVTEQRQLLAFLRAQGCSRFGLLGTSYGGWTASLLSFVESDWRFLTLIQPVVDLEHAIWENPAAASIRRILARQGIGAGLSRRHAHLTSPLHGVPLVEPEQITIIAGSYDTVAPPAALRELAAAWPGANYVEVRQGHFGYAAMEEAKRRISPSLA